ncbi:WecB/TagA/CpsF family glycosyltransferase [Mesobacillus maritimus]|uniref:WecB/TagA/CpsF family glycosyltransferase n=1 Tax=Mesobacillus maritimus TaxID=1643336 RepID=UPI00203BDC6E|nr:WecB/TagA/CpsF family glycosyltransferase [Mesobacillus maritimus]MCM3668079.1 WecB/TagA/CpsF family glycosyltransferase [Mesobacillus maritimus]
MVENFVKILGIPFITKRFNEMMDLIVDKITSKEKTFIVTANPEIVMQAKKNHDYFEVVQSANYVVPDGYGIILASRMLQTPIPERVTGYDITIRLLELSNQRGWKVYLLGGKKEVNDAAAASIQKDYPHVNLVGRHHGFFNWEDGKVAKEIEDLQPDIVLVALGVPRQELWIAKHIDRFNHGIFIGVGGSIDVLAGTVKRAPKIWQALKIEWLYRLVKQPSRWRRMLALPEFVMEVLKEKFSSKK